MEIYLLTYNNGEPYEMNDNYTIAIFDDLKKAHEFCVNKGFKESDTKGYYKKEGSTWGTNKMYESIAIDTIKMNKELDINGEVIKDEKESCKHTPIVIFEDPFGKTIKCTKCGETAKLDFTRYLWAK